MALHGRRIRLVACDLDGTFYRTDSRLFSRVRAGIKKAVLPAFRGRGPLTDEKIYTRLPSVFPNIMDLFHHMRIPLAELKRAYENADIETVGRDERLVSKMRELDCRFGVVTYAPFTYAREVTARLGAYPFIGDFFTLEFFERQGHPYEKLAAYEKLRMKFGLSASECAVIGDNWEVDMKGASSQGYLQILVADLCRPAANLPSGLVLAKDLRHALAYIAERNDEPVRRPS